MADITISDLELAPALTDDMVLPVENTTDTYAATLAMLRRLINKTFVEVENADFNALTDDGFYQCTGTPTNSPVAGAINWTLQVSAENGVVVQRAFSLDDNFANLYIRRWNGVTWTGWLDVGKEALDNKANVSNTVTTDTVQTITGFKTFNNGSGNNRTNILVVTDDGVGDDTNVKWAGSIQFKKGNVNVGFCEALRNSENASIAQIVAHNSVDGQEVYASLKSVATSDGNTFAMAPTPPVGFSGDEIVTAGWFNSKMQVVSALPANPDPNVFYFIPE